MTLDFLQVQRTSRGRRWTNQIRGSAWLREWGVAAVRMMELNGGGGGHGDWPSAAQQNRSRTVMRGIERKETERTWLIHSRGYWNIFFATKVKEWEGLRAKKPRHRWIHIVRMWSIACLLAPIACLHPRRSLWYVVIEFSDILLAIQCNSSFITLSRFRQPE